MTWIKTTPRDQAEGALREALESQRATYPPEYATPSVPGLAPGGSIVESHSLIPDALHHAFATFGALMSPDLPLARRQHEMIATVVSATNRCHY
jgi:alkylhydroperoxidase family enzyme